VSSLTQCSFIAATRASRFAQLGRQQTRLVVARRGVGFGDDRAQVAQRDLVRIPDRGFGEVAPFDCSDLPAQVVREREDRRRVDRLFAFGREGAALRVE
jgi:hypothetical protein